MAETTYKKGELLFEESITTNNSDDLNTAYCQTEMFLNQDVLIIEFDNIEYTCEAFRMEGWPISCYGGMSAQGPDFSFFPFALNNTMNAGAQTSAIWLGTKNPGTHSLKVYTAVEDSNSDTSNEPLTIRSYITKNLPSLNWNILPQIFAENGVEMNEKIEAYLRNTPENTNWSILEQLGGSEDGDNTLPKKIIIDGYGRYYSYPDSQPFPEGSDFNHPSDLYEWLMENCDVDEQGIKRINSDKLIFITSNGELNTRIYSDGRVHGDKWIWGCSEADDYCWLTATEFAFDYDN